MPSGLSVVRVGSQPTKQPVALTKFGSVEHMTAAPPSAPAVPVPVPVPATPVLPAMLPAPPVPTEPLPPVPTEPLPPVPLFTLPAVPLPVAPAWFVDVLLPEPVASPPPPGGVEAVGEQL